MKPYKNMATYLIALLCGYLALVTPDWKSQLMAAIPGYVSNIDSDGDDDLIQVNAAGDIKVFELENSASLGVSIDANVPDFIVTGDFDGDRDLDYLSWDGTGSLVITEMYYRSISATHDLGAFSSAYEVIGTGDFDGDRDDDIAFYRPSDGRVVIWQMENNTVVSQNWMGDFLQTAYRPVGFGDVDLDGDDDLFWVRYTGADNNLVVVWWFENGTRNDKLNDGAWLQSYYNNDYKIRAIADTNGDWPVDVVWRSTVDGNVVVWKTGWDSEKSRPAVVANIWAGQFANTAFDIVEAADTTADNIMDLIWYNSTNGAVNIWEMNNNAMSASKSVLATSNTAFVPVEKDFTRRYD